MLPEAVPWQSWTDIRPSPWKNILLRRNHAPRGQEGELRLEDYPDRPQKTVQGWCSWHHFGRRINEKLVLDQVRKIREGMTTSERGNFYILIDDGWSRWGDWEGRGNGQFPSEMGETAEKLKTMGFRPGIWMAPFLVDPGSKLAVDHPDWLIEDRLGRKMEGMMQTPVDRHLGYKKWMIDIRKEPARQYLHQVMDRIVNNWGYELVKMDFLYAPYFYPDLQGGEGRDILRGFLGEVRKTVGSAYLMACGCPLEAAVGIMDSIRVARDVTLPWAYGKIPKKLLGWMHKGRIRMTEEKLLAWSGWEKKIALDPDAFCQGEELGVDRKTRQEWREMWKNCRVRFVGDKY